MKSAIANRWIDIIINSEGKISKIIEKTNGEIIIRAHWLKDKVRISLFIKPKVSKSPVKYIPKALRVTKKDLVNSYKEIKN